MAFQAYLPIGVGNHGGYASCLLGNNYSTIEGALGQRNSLGDVQISISIYLGNMAFQVYLPIGLENRGGYASHLLSIYSSIIGSALGQRNNQGDVQITL